MDPARVRGRPVTGGHRLAWRLVLAVAVGAAAAVTVVVVLAVVGSAPGARDLGAPWSGEVVSAPAPDIPDDPRAEALLHAAVLASREVSYSGVAAVQEWGAQGGVGRVVEVDRIAGTGTRIRVRGSMEDPVDTPESGAPGVAPGDAGRVVGLLAANFGVGYGPLDHVAGRRARVVEVRRSSGPVAARLWIDVATGLVLRREVYDAGGRSAQSAGFLSVRLQSPRSRVRPAVETGTAPAVDGGSERGWLQPADLADLPDWRSQGWVCPEALPDGLTLVDVRRSAATEDGSVVQLVYSDGLVTLSLFQQRGRLDPSSLVGFRPTEVGGVPAWTGSGVPAQVVWQSGDAVLTLVADAPSDLIAAVVAALPGTVAAGDDLATRVARGWSRVAEAVTPW